VSGCLSWVDCAWTAVHAAASAISVNSFFIFFF
jgi:hypothetical protein